MNTIPNTPREVYNAAHPFFVIDATRSRTRSDILRWALTSIPDAYIAEYVGTVVENGKLVIIDRMFVWYYNPAFRYPDETYQPGTLVCFLQKLGFDIGERDVNLHYSNDCYGGIGCELAPIVAFPEGFVLSCMCGNMTCPEYYIELMSQYRSNIVAMGGSEHHIRDVQNQPTGKEDS